MALNQCGVETSTGAALFYKDPADDTYKELIGVTAFPQFGFTHGTASCDDSNAANNGWGTSYKNGKKEGGASTVDYNWRPGDAIQDLLWPAFVSQDVSEFRMQWSDVASTRLDFSANITAFNVNTPPATDDDNKITRGIGVDLSGEPIWA